MSRDILMRRTSTEVQMEWIGDITSNTTIANTTVKFAVADDGQLVMVAPPGGGVTPVFNPTTKAITNGAATGSILRKIANLEIDASQIVSGITPIQYGGTGISAPGVPGALLYGVSTTALGYTPVGSTGQVLLSGGTGAPSWTTGTLALGGNFILAGSNSVTLNTTGATNITLPTSGTLATEAYVQNRLNGITWKTAVKAATTAALSGTTYTYANGTSGVGATLTPLSAQSAISFIDGVTVVDQDRVLIKNQSNAAHNGIYTVTVSGGVVTVLTRATDADESSDLTNASVMVYSGTVNDNRQYTTQNPVVTMGTTNIDWVQISGPGTSIGLSDGMIFVGNSSSIATAVNMGGDATISNTGVLTLANANSGASTYVLTFAGGTTASIFSYDIKGRITSTTASSIALNLGTADVTGTLTSNKGGTGFSTYTTGDMIYASASNTLSKLGASTNGYVLTMVGGVPAWAAATGGFTLGAIGSSPNANGATYSAGILVLQPASASFGGVITTGSQTFAGDKGFIGIVSTASSFQLSGTTANIIHTGSATTANIFSGTASTLTTLNVGTDTSLINVNIGANNASTVVTIGGASGGTLKAIVKEFDIMDPRYNDSNKRLVHACIESNENGVYYRGEARLENGETEIILPEWFESLTAMDGRTILLTPIFEGSIETLAPTRIVNGKFKVYGVTGNNKNQTFYWEVKAVRKDIPMLEAEQYLDMPL